MNQEIEELVTRWRAARLAAVQAEKALERAYQTLRLAQGAYAEVDRELTTRLHQWKIGDSI